MFRTVFLEDNVFDQHMRHGLFSDMLSFISCHFNVP